MPKSHKRAEDKATMTVSLPATLLQKIDVCAAGERRTRSNWVVLKLERAVELYESQKKLDAGAPRIASMPSLTLNEAPPTDHVPNSKRKPTPKPGHALKPIRYKAGRANEKGGSPGSKT